MENDPRPEPNTTGYIVRVAKETDAAAIHSFAFSNPDNNVRKRSLEEVRQIIRERTLHIATLRPEDAPVVAVCYVDLSRSEAPREWELGGAHVAEAHRRGGLFRILASTAIINHYLNNQPKDGSHEQIIAHVVRENPKPRRTLERLGFETREADQRYRPTEIPGLEHMPTDAGGYIYADTLALPRSAICQLIRELADNTGTLEGADREQRPVEIKISSLGRETLLAALEELNCT
jgi:hypothetical protein